jgi:hypothetical protein
LNENIQNKEVEQMEKKKSEKKVSEEKKWRKICSKNGVSCVIISK